MNATTLMKKSKSNFALAFIGLEKSKRTALQALYAFCRTVDDIVDNAKDFSSAQAELNRWRGILDRISAPSVFDPPIAWDLAKACQNFPIVVDDLRWIIDGVETDLYKKRYQTFEELISYCDGVASAVGLASLAIFGGKREETEAYAFATGRALQLTNILRDVGTDSKMGRIYLPSKDMEQFRYSEKDLTRGKYNEAFIQLMQFQKTRVLQFYEAAENALDAETRKQFPSAELMRKLYRALLNQIEARKYNVFQQKVRLPRTRKLAIAIKIWLPHFLRHHPSKTGNA